LIEHFLLYFYYLPILYTYVSIHCGAWRCRRAQNQQRERGEAGVKEVRQIPHFSKTVINDFCSACSSLNFTKQSSIPIPGPEIEHHSLKMVEGAIRVLEDDPHLNAGQIPFASILYFIDSSVHDTYVQAMVQTSP